MSLLAIQDLTVTYPARHGRFTAVDGVSFEVAEGETVGLVGESGCGKSTLGKALIRLARPSSGSIRLAGSELAQASERELAPHRHKMQMVFQDPYGSLNPRQSIYRQLDTPLKVHGVQDAAERRRRILAITDRIGISRQMLERYPHEFSGGQKQRVGIARALVLQPRLLVCDEPVSALDLSIQAQILNLLAELKQEYGLSYVFISHDLSVVRYISDRVLVMYLGRIVESADHATLFQSPSHPYTRALLAAVPSQHQGQRQIDTLRGEIGSSRSTGCAFAARCPQAAERCRREVPLLRPIGVGHAAACHFA